MQREGEVVMANGLYEMTPESRRQVLASATSIWPLVASAAKDMPRMNTTIIEPVHPLAKNVKTVAKSPARPAADISHRPTKSKEVEVPTGQGREDSEFGYLPPAEEDARLFDIPDDVDAVRDPDEFSEMGMDMDF
jgi:hypothetical protein